MSSQSFDIARNVGSLIGKSVTVQVKGEADITGILDGYTRKGISIETGGELRNIDPKMVLNILTSGAPSLDDASMRPDQKGKP